MAYIHILDETCLSFMDFQIKSLKSISFAVRIHIHPVNNIIPGTELASRLQPSGKKMAWSDHWRGVYWIDKRDLCRWQEPPWQDAA